MDTFSSMTTGWVAIAPGLVAIQAIFRGIDREDFTMSAFNAAWWTASLGYLGLYPIWSILLGRSLLGR